ncbi:hypothetical protein D3C85_875740 [compost metagenome]
MRDRLAVLVAHATGHDDALADGQAAIVEVQQQVVVMLAKLEVRKIRAGGFAGRLRDADQRLARGAGNGGLVVGRQRLGVPIAIADDEATGVCGRHVVLLLLDFWSALRQA